MSHDVMAEARRLESTAQLVRDYANGDANVAMLRHYDALIATYKVELVTVTPDGLLSLQAKVQQLEALREVVRGELKTNGRI